MLMCVPERGRQLDSYLGRIGEGEGWALVEQRAKVASLNQFHDDRIGVVGSDRVVDGDDPRVGQSCSCLGFATKAVENRMVFGEMSVENFDGDLATEVVVDAFPYFGHPSAAATDNHFVAVAKTGPLHTEVWGSVGHSEMNATGRVGTVEISSLRGLVRDTDDARASMGANHCTNDVGSSLSDAWNIGHRLHEVVDVGGIGMEDGEV